MAAGKINLQANDGKVAGIVFEDGAAGNVAITLPKEGGMLTIDTEVVHNTGNETIAGIKTFSSNTIFNGNVLFSNGTFGYGTGSGGTVTQATSKSTTVTLNRPTGTITMSNSALASGTKISFYLNNSLIENNDIVVAYPSYGSAYINQYEVRTRSGSGASEIIVSQTSGSTLSDAITINFVLIKGALS